jgi:hypothetical protein
LDKRLLMQKRFIEYNLPLAEISEQSAREKNIRHGYPSTLHIWWARRPLASSRATAFAALIDDPGPDHPQEREEIRKLIEEITPWEAVKDGNSLAIKRAQKMIHQQYGRPPRAGPLRWRRLHPPGGTAPGLRNLRQRLQPSGRLYRKGHARAATKARYRGRVATRVG